jgi:hypothetical protein
MDKNTPHPPQHQSEMPQAAISAVDWVSGSLEIRKREIPTGAFLSVE